MDILKTFSNGLTSGLTSGASNGFGLKGLLNGAINNFFNKKAEQRQLKNNMKLMDYQNQLNQENEYSSMSRQVAGMKAAGVNPALSEGSAPATVGSSQVSQGNSNVDTSGNNALVTSQMEQIEKQNSVSDSVIDSNNANADLTREKMRGEKIMNDNLETRLGLENRGLELGNAYQEFVNRRYNEHMDAIIKKTLGDAALSQVNKELAEIDKETRGEYNSAIIRNIKEQTNLYGKQADQAASIVALNGVLQRLYGNEADMKGYQRDVMKYIMGRNPLDPVYSPEKFNPFVKQYFTDVEKLVTEIDRLKGLNDFTGAQQVAQEFANKTAPADKALQWGNLILNTVWNGAMIYMMVRGARGMGTPTPGNLGNGSVRSTPRVTPTSPRVGLSSPSSMASNYNSLTATQKNQVFDWARRQGYRYDAASGNWLTNTRSPHPTSSSNLYEIYKRAHGIK